MFACVVPSEVRVAGKNKKGVPGTHSENAPGIRLGLSYRPSDKTGWASTVESLFFSSLVVCVNWQLTNAIGSSGSC